MQLRPVLCFAALALCALGACDKTPVQQPGASGTGGSVADGGGGAGASSAAGELASSGGTGSAGKPGGDEAGSSAPTGGKSGSGGTPAANGGTDEPQGGAGAGGSESGGAGGTSEQAGTGGSAGGDAGSSAQGGSGGAAGAGGAGGSAAPVCEPDALCVGPMLSSSACGLAPATSDVPLTATTCPGKRTCQGAAAPQYRLTDFQGATSCGTGASYGLDAFSGHTTLVCIFASWCDYCKMQTEKLDQLRLDLPNIDIVVINQAGYDPADLTWRTSGAVLQDTAEVNAWGLHGVEKDDLLIYRGDGTLEAWLQPPGTGGQSIDLTTTEGYTYVKMRLMNTP